MHLWRWTAKRAQSVNSSEMIMFICDICCPSTCPSTFFCQVKLQSSRMSSSKAQKNLVVHWLYRFECCRRFVFSWSSLRSSANVAFSLDLQLELLLVHGHRELVPISILLEKNIHFIWFFWAFTSCKKLCSGLSSSYFIIFIWG